MWNCQSCLLKWDKLRIRPKKFPILPTWTDLQMCPSYIHKMFIRSTKSTLLTYKNWLSNVQKLIGYPTYKMCSSNLQILPIRPTKCVHPTYKNCPFDYKWCPSDLYKKCPSDSQKLPIWPTKKGAPDLLRVQATAYSRSDAPICCF